MELPFYKYQGCGNDFIIIDNRTLLLPRTQTALIHRLCDRRFGIGADGLIYLQDADGCDFEMIYFNSDGREGTMCGNGGRCIVRFAYELGLGPAGDDISFIASDGLHRARMLSEGVVSLRMQDVRAVIRHGDEYILDTGSPHIVRFVADARGCDVPTEGRRIRMSDHWDFPPALTLRAGQDRADGINVNFAEQVSDDTIFVRTYERGVEAETLSCGTGVTAAAIAFYYRHPSRPGDIKIETPGGRLQVHFDVPRDGHFTGIWLTGPAVPVFEGTIGI